MEKTYRTILADFTANFGCESCNNSLPLDSRTIQKIKDLPIAGLANPDSSVCLIWVNRMTLRHGLEILETWGFTTRSIMTNILPNFMFLGSQHAAVEHLLIGTRGHNPTIPNAKLSEMSKTLQHHLSDPAQQFETIEKELSEGPYLDLFGRTNRPGWDAYLDDFFNNQLDTETLQPENHPLASDA